MLWIFATKRETKDTFINVFEVVNACKKPQDSFIAFYSSLLKITQQNFSNNCSIAKDFVEKFVAATVLSEGHQMALRKFFGGLSDENIR